MGLDDLNEKIYKEPEENLRKHEGDVYDPFQKQHEKSETLHQEKSWGGYWDNLSDYKRRLLKIGVAVVGAVIVIVGITMAVIQYKESLFSEEKISISIEGPENVESVAATSYIIKYKNNNKVDLLDAEILLNYSENFRPEQNENFQAENVTNGKITVGTIKSRSEGSVELKGRFYGPKDFVVYLNATLNYKPSNFNSLFQAKTQRGIAVKTSPLFLDITAPLEAPSGDKVEYVIDYKNFSDQYLDNLRLKLEYPQGFIFSSADPAPSEGNNFWYLGALDKNGSGKVKISGILNGEYKNGKIVKAIIGMINEQGEFVSYTEKEKNTKIAGSPLSVTQIINGQTDFSVDAGETLNYRIGYANKGDIGLRNVIISLEINSPILNFSQLKLKGGSYDAARKMIFWKASDVPDLAILPPGKSGEILFSIPIVSSVPIVTENDKNFTFYSIAKIDSPDIPTTIGSNKVISSSRLEMKLNTKVIFAAIGYYNDWGIPNSGPIPPKVGEKTTYTIHWQISNMSNDVSGVKVVSSMPSGVRWENKLLPANENIQYNERTNQLIWEVGTLKNGTGIISPKREVSFQVSITPQINQVGETAGLLHSSVLTAKDTFTGKDLRIEEKEISINIINDKEIPQSGYKVVN